MNIDQSDYQVIVRALKDRDSTESMLDGVRRLRSIIADLGRPWPDPEVTLVEPLATFDRVLRLFERINCDVSDLEIVLRHVDTARRLNTAARWLDRVGRAAPKSILEPFVGDLREEITTMIDAGRSPAAVWWVTVSELAVFVSRCGWLMFRR